MTALKNIITKRISLGGPISIADYFTQCLFHPVHGYYVAQSPFGAKGDFITAPAISQMFGELTSVWLIECWKKLGSPNKFTLCEIGPGDGTWIEDIIRTIVQLSPTMSAAADITMLEQSPRLQDVQKERLGAVRAGIRWINDIEDIANHPVIFIGNELFDAIPIRQFVRIGDRWIERTVSLDDNDNLCFAIGTATLDANLLPPTAHDASEGAIFEYAPAREALVQQLTEKIAKNRGAALFIDYGHVQSSVGDTLQAVQDHKPIDVFKAPGLSDLTSHVDFETLRLTARQFGAKTYDIITQSEFLLGLGLVERAGQLGSSKDANIQQEIVAAVNRLAGNADGHMGDLFKVFCISDMRTQAPAPFK